MAPYSLGVVLPKEVVNRLRKKDGQPLFLMEAPDGGYRLTPYDPAFEARMAKAEAIIGRHASRTVLELAAGAVDVPVYAQFLRSNARRARRRS